MKSWRKWILMIALLLLPFTLEASTKTITRQFQPDELSKDDLQIITSIKSVAIDVCEQYIGGYHAKRIKQLPLGDFVRAFIKGAGINILDSKEKADAWLTIQIAGKEVGGNYSGNAYVNEYFPTGGGLDVLFLLQPKSINKSFQFRFHCVNNDVPEKIYGPTGLWEFVWAENVSVYFDEGVYKDIGSLVKKGLGENKAIAGWGQVIKDCRPIGPESMKYIEQQPDSVELDTIRQYAIKSLAAIGSPLALETMMKATADDTYFMRDEAQYWIKQASRKK
jgi:hypothetical protein